MPLLPNPTRQGGGPAHTSLHSAAHTSHTQPLCRPASKAAAASLKPRCECTKCSAQLHTPHSGRKPSTTHVSQLNPCLPCRSKWGGGGRRVPSLVVTAAVLRCCALGRFPALETPHAVLQQRWAVHIPHHPALRGPADRGPQALQGKVGAEPRSADSQGSAPHAQAQPQAVLPTVVILRQRRAVPLVLVSGEPTKGSEEEGEESHRVPTTSCVPGRPEALGFSL